MFNGFAKVLPMVCQVGKWLANGWQMVGRWLLVVSPYVVGPGVGGEDEGVVGGGFCLVAHGGREVGVDGSSCNTLEPADGALVAFASDFEAAFVSGFEKWQKERI